MSTSQTFGEVPNSPIDIFLPAALKQWQLSSATPVVLREIQIFNFFYTTWSQSVKYNKFASHKHPEAGCVALVETSGAPAAMYFAVGLQR